MEQLLALLKDGRSRTIEMLAAELNTSTDDIERKIDFLERSGLIRRVATSFPSGESLLTAGKNSAAKPSCSGHCSSCSGCTACMSKDGFKNMGAMWEVL
jgi:DeoR/GlpR family transcriptional regulator of sugar metabolism